MRSIWQQATSGDWVAPTFAFVVGVARADLAEREAEYVTHEISDPIDKILTWGVTILAIVLAVGYQVLPRLDALQSLARRHGR